MGRLFYRLSEMCWEVRYAVQRVYQGYDNRDVFEFYNNFLKRNAKILKDYKKNNAGYPRNLTEDEWDNILQEMADCFENSDEIVAAKNLYGGFDEFIDNWNTERQVKLNEYVEKNKDRGFDLLKEFFFHLWY